MNATVAYELRQGHTQCHFTAPDLFGWRDKGATPWCCTIQSRSAWKMPLAWLPRVAPNRLFP
jgi:hypothetical protein